MNILSKRIPTLLGLVLLIGVVGGAFVYFKMKTGANNIKIINESVKITNKSDNKFSVSWLTEDEVVGEIEYNEVGIKTVNKQRDDRDVTTQNKYMTHHVTVSGLQPNTQYSFNIVSDKAKYSVSTGPVIGETPNSINFYGEVRGDQVAGSLAYLKIPGGSEISTLVSEQGKYAFTLSTVRSEDLHSFLQVDLNNTTATLMIDSQLQKSSSKVLLVNSSPVPTITLGQDSDFLTKPENATIAEIYNVEPLVNDNDINAINTSQGVTITNPQTSGETLTTLRPEFKGNGPANTTLSIALTGQKAISDTISIDTYGAWNWTPLIDLKSGKQTITVSYTNTSGATQKVAKEFTVNASITGLDTPIVASTSASVKKLSPSPTTRAAMPDTDSGVPVTGVIENTLLTTGIGVVIMVVGAALLVL